MRTKTWKSHQSIVHRIFFMLFVSEGLMARTALKHKQMVSKWWKNQSAMISFSKSYLLCIFFSDCALIFLVVQELSNVHNNWKLHCAWVFQLLRTHTWYLYMKDNWAIPLWRTYTSEDKIDWKNMYMKGTWKFKLHQLHQLDVNISSNKKRWMFSLKVG